MDNDRLEKWLGALGHVAVIVGLIVVAIELHQSAAVANGELSAQFMSNWQELDRSRQEPSFAGIYAKSMEDPQDLTLEEQIRLDGYYLVVIQQMELAKMLVELKLFDSSYERILRENVRLVFTTPYSHAWWKAYSINSDSTTIAIVNDELSRIPIDAERKRFELLSTLLREQS